MWGQGLSLRIWECNGLGAWGFGFGAWDLGAGGKVSGLRVGMLRFSCYEGLKVRGLGVKRS